MTKSAPAQIKKTPPLVETYGDTQRITTIFYWFIALISMGLIAGIFIVLSVNDTLGAAFLASGILPVIASIYLIRRQKFELTAATLAVLLISLITLMATRGLGVHHISILGYPAILIVASLVTRKRIMVIITLYNLLCVAWLVFGELSGAFVPTILVHSVVGDFFSVAIIVVLTAIMAGMVTASLFQSSSRLQIELNERKLAEEKYRNIFDNAIVGIFQSTPAGRLIGVNPAMAHMYGYASPEEMVTAVTDIANQIYIDPGARDVLRLRLEAGETVKEYESLEYRRDGSTLWTSMNAQVVRAMDGSTLYYEGTVEDITLRKKVEAEREHLIQELAAKNKELEQFTYTVSHDLKAPIITIRGFLGFLEKDLVEGKQTQVHKDVMRIDEAVAKMHRLLNELLELSRIGRMLNKTETLPFQDLVDAALENVHGRIAPRGITVQISSPQGTQPNLPTVHGDRQRLIEVMQNLLDNAAKYMGNQPSPHIEVGQSGEKDGKPVFFVKDNGIGIAPEYHERIFGLFNKLNPQSEGTGIGLALVKKIIEVHNGTIWVESEAGQGATFYFTLPVTANE